MGLGCLPKQICRKYSDWVRPHRAASCFSLAFSSSVSLIFSRTFSSCVFKLIPPFCQISAVGGGIQGASPGFGFCPVGGKIRCSLSLWTGQQRVTVFCCHLGFSSYPLLQLSMPAIPVDRATAGNSVLLSLRLFLLSPTTTFNARNGTFFLSHFQKSYSPLANKETGYIHNRTSRTAQAPLVFVLVCVCNRLCLYQSDQPIQLALP